MTIIVLESLFTKLHKIIEMCGVKLTVTNFLLYFYTHVFWHLHIRISVTNNNCYLFYQLPMLGIFAYLMRLNCNNMFYMLVTIKTYLDFMIKKLS